MPFHEQNPHAVFQSDLFYPFFKVVICGNQGASQDKKKDNNDETAYFSIHLHFIS
jgi:hypothetical protein